ncbi:MAG: SpoIIE family protein phosphatase [Planctomycetes bacterium]|nr:SpoIIE family protein phosphatase [Planctomycetota bacterium]
MSLEHDPRRIQPPDRNRALADPASANESATLEHLLGHLASVEQQLDRATGQLHDLEQRDHVLQQGLAKLKQQMERARQLQDDLLPRSLPECDSLRISTLYVPANDLSGDIYDVVRLSDRQLSINIADATGHDMAAALLSSFMKQSLRVCEAAADRTRRAGIEYPRELLSKLNDDLVATDLSECHFLTSIHAVFDEVDRNLLWARGGMPYPILVRRGESAQRIVSEGGLIGAFADQQFDSVSTHLGPGDIMLLFTDGLEALLLNAGPGRGAAKLLDTPWCQALTGETLETHLHEIEELLRNSSPDDWPADDVTILALEGLPAE